MPRDLVSWGMFDTKLCKPGYLPEYLIAREQDEMFRTSARTLTFPDGKTRRVEAYRLVWRWFDHCAACEFALDADQLLDATLDCMAEEGLEIGHALARVVDYFVAFAEQRGGDLTDDILMLDIARPRMANWNRGKAAR